MNYEKHLYDTTFETEAQLEVRELARKFARDRILPLVEHDELSQTFRPEIIRELGELGLTGIPTDEAFGGMGLGYQEYVAVVQELAAVSASYAVSVCVSGLPQMIIQKFGTEAQKQKYIPNLASGQAIGAFALSEAGSGSDAGSLRTSAVKHGDHYILNGTKLWITQADDAEVMIMMARTGAEGPKGVSAFILEKGMPGIKMGKKDCRATRESQATGTKALKAPIATGRRDRETGTSADGSTVCRSALRRREPTSSGSRSRARLLRPALSRRWS